MLGTATYKVSRLVTKGKVTSFLRAPFARRQEAVGGSEVMDEPRRQGAVRHAVGELLSCPFCASSWVATGLGAGMRRHACDPDGGPGLSAVVISDWLNSTRGAIPSSRWRADIRAVAPRESTTGGDGRAVPAAALTTAAFRSPSRWPRCRAPQELQRVLTRSSPAGMRRRHVAAPCEILAPPRRGLPACSGTAAAVTRRVIPSHRS
ncbi:DUF1360 domain-containing protein [Streptomyces sp. NPDC059371]|uniref:DUF1360 domain-containing protein n=1 Tax=Streptomyces sp. NPDC059371 TaxID=3346812 RepID=UPI0036BEE6C1